MSAWRAYCNALDFEVKMVMALLGKSDDDMETVASEFVSRYFDPSKGVVTCCDVSDRSSSSCPGAMPIKRSLSDPFFLLFFFALAFFSA